jgi:hypothetical protein
MRGGCGNGIEHDHYGKGSVVEAFEGKIATLLGMG